MYKNEDLAYIAGLIDGEGYLGIFRTSSKTKHLQSIIVIGLQSKETIDFVQSIFHGSINTSYTPSAQRAGMYYWKLYSKERQKEFLSLLLPYLKAKKDVALILLQYLDRGPRVKSAGRGKGAIAVHYLEDEQDYWAIRKLNSGKKSGKI